MLIAQFHNEELHNFYSSPNIIRVSKESKIRWMGHVERMGQMRNAYNILVGNREERRPLGRCSLGGKLILKWI
jgi:hypothetical protein